MKIINNVLKAIVFLINSCFIFFNSVGDIVAVIYFEQEYIHLITGEIILLILYIYLTYLFYRNTILNEPNNFKISIISIIAIILGGILYTIQCKSIYIILTKVFFVFYCLPIVILLISVKFNELYMKKLKN